MARLRFLFVFTLVIVSASEVAACTRNVVAEAARTQVPNSGFDHVLLDRAVRAEVNFHRCRAGLDSVKYAGDALLSRAELHSSWMARKNQLSHFNTMRGLSSLGERVRSANITYRTASENLVAVHQYHIDNRRFRTINRKACQFAIDGELVPPHSYASLARHAVQLWMSSPAHRTNILSPQTQKMVVAIARSNTRRHCGKFWLAQNFIS